MTATTQVEQDPAYCSLRRAPSFLLFAGAAGRRRAAGGDHAGQAVGALGRTMAQPTDGRWVLARALRGRLVRVAVGRVAYERLAFGVGVTRLSDARAAAAGDRHGHDEEESHVT